MLGSGEKGEDGKRGKKWRGDESLPLLVEEKRGKKENDMGGRDFPPRPTKYYPPKLGGKFGGKNTLPCKLLFAPFNYNLFFK